MKRAALITMTFLLLCVAFSFGALALCENGAHEFGPWVDIDPATCSKTGIQQRQCTKCGYTQEQPKNAIDHQYNTEYTVDTEPTCTTAGSKSYHCRFCGTPKPNSSVAIPATGHSFGQWKATSPNTCTDGGIEERVCSVCSFKETRTVAALGHEKVTVPAKEPTCLENGTSEKIYCKRCNYVFQEALVTSALGHDMVTIQAKEPTCTEDGNTAGRYCKRCDYVETKSQSIPKLGHKTVIDPASPSTCTVHGKTQGSHCSVCNTVFYAQQELPLLPHDYKETVVKKTCISDGYHQFTCSVCGDFYRTDIDYAYGHNIVVEKAIEETCTTDGLSVKTYCSVCGEVLEDARVIPARGHTWVETTTKATRKADGIIVTTCKDCGTKKGETVIPKIASITLSKTKYYCDGKKKTPDIVIRDSAGNKLVYKKDFKTSWDSGRKKAGTYYVTISFIGNYSGAKTLRFRILLHKPSGVKAAAAKGSAKVTWTKITGAQSYVVYICETKDGTYKKAGTVKGTSLTVKKLQSGKTYYFIVRAQAKDAAGNVVKSERSPVRKAKIA